MPAELPLPFLVLVHQGGWDEMLMVAVGLIVAYAVITWTGRRSREEDTDEGDELENGGLEDDQVADLAESAAERPVSRPDEPPRATP
jgi:hypothetical protein